MARTPIVLPALAYLRASALLQGWLERGDRLAGAILSQALTAEEKSELALRLYDGSSFHRGTAIFPWERTWYASALPGAPARILVGACGAGREVLALVAAGHGVDAFEPAAGLCELARARAAERARIRCFRYEDLAAAVLDGSAGPAAELAHERYDAVLLGWGSLNHVLDAEERRRLLIALDRLCPRGPLLVSFLSDEHEPIVGRLERLGAASGRLLARLLRRRIERSSRESFSAGMGFVHPLSGDEIDALARSVGRAAVREDDGFPHVTMVRHA